MPRVPGRLLRAKINGEYIACETSCDFNYEVEMRGASAVTSGRWKEVIPGVRSWGLTLNANLMLSAAGANIQPILNAIMTGEVLDIEFRTDISLVPELAISGKVFVSGGSIGSAVGSNVSWNTSFTGSGPFAYTAGSFNVGFGYSATDPFGDEEELEPQFFKDIGSVSMDLDYTTASAGNYLYAIVPTALTTVFDEWFNNIYNFGTIPDFVWREPVVIGANRYYISRDPLYFTSDESEITFTKS